MTMLLEERYILDAVFLDEDLADIAAPLDAVLGRKSHVSLLLRKRDIYRNTAMEVLACRKKSLISLIVDVTEITDRQTRRVRVSCRFFALRRLLFRRRTFRR